MIKLNNTLTKKIETLEPIKGFEKSGRKGKINMFVCGPTVYDYIHIGNARTFVVFDVVAKYLRHRGFEVFYLQNITDIDDKIIARAQEQSKDPLEFAKDYEQKFKEDTRHLGVTAVNTYARATDHIKHITKQVQALIDKGSAYLIKDDGYYFDLSTFPDYGKLSGRTAQMADDAVSRIDDSDKKRSAGDFALWKFSKKGEPSWKTKLGKGRPGWHIEDTAISEHFLGPQYDIHGGGRDLMFPHHEAEIAQEETISGLKPFVKYWMHVGFLEAKSAKMSKSAGNFATVHELLEKYLPQVLRFYLLSAHYRSPLDFSDKILAQAEAGIQRIAEFLERLKFFEESKSLANGSINNGIHKFDEIVVGEFQKLHEKVIQAMDNDFNTPQAIAILFDMIRLGHSYLDHGKIDLHSTKKILEILDIFDHMMGIIPHQHFKLPEKVVVLVKERQDAKENKDFGRADFIRSQIQALGYQIDDTPYGPLVKPSH